MLFIRGQGENLCPLFSFMDSYSLSIRTLLFSVQVESGSPDPLLLYHLRGEHEKMLALESPCKGRSSCTDRVSCPFHTSFGQTLSPDPELVRRHQKPPIPFAWQMPLLHSPRINKQYSCSLHLFGRAALYADTHAAAIERMQISGGRVSLNHCTPDNPASAPFSCGKLSDSTVGVNSFFSWNDLISLATEFPPVVSIDFLTPLRIMSEGKVSTFFDPSLFFRHMLRRLSALAAYYGETEAVVDYQDLSRLSREVRIVRNGMKWEKWSSSLQGLTGRVEIEGPIREFIPFLLLGEYANAGKGSAYGLGRYCLVR